MRTEKINNIFAYIPARGGSKRLPRKNIKLLQGVPVLVHVIENLKKLDIAGVVVSTEDEEIAKIAIGAGAITLSARTAALAQDNVQFMDLIKNDVSRYCDHFATPHVLFVLATAALVTPEVFDRAVHTYFKNKPAVLLSTTKYPISPFWGLSRDQSGTWRPLFPEMAHLPTDQHPMSRVDAGAFYTLDIERCQHVQSIFEANPLEIFDIPDYAALDIDTHQDWDQLVERYEKIKQTNTL
jgi:N-acylneuraminate cytidylyltransferase